MNILYALMLCGEQYWVLYKLQYVDYIKKGKWFICKLLKHIDYCEWIKKSMYYVTYACLSFLSLCILSNIHIVFI